MAQVVRRPLCHRRADGAQHAFAVVGMDVSR
jgi:hypothetical protein